MNIEEYAELLDRKEWKNKRESILKRDDYTCQKCGRRGFSFRHSRSLDILSLII